MTRCMNSMSECSRFANNGTCSIDWNVQSTFSWREDVKQTKKHLSNLRRAIDMKVIGASVCVPKDYERQERFPRVCRIQDSHALAKRT